MNTLAVVLIAWVVLSPLWALLLGRAIRSNTRTPNRTTARRPAPAWARQNTRRRP
ncbi:hypothetical protein ACODT5_15465 [Streptomyces sp. 5.8]|uniref:hypothetical protein n=1 Tax=Streptomyces sp. 5.8 TaxID=3406571 RepID=UPI003BB651A9